MPTIPAERLQPFAEQLLAAGGALPPEAARVATSLVAADLRGYESHGVMRIPYYVEMIQCGEIVPGAEFTVLSETDTNLAANGNWGFGQMQAGTLARKLFDKADQNGVAIGTMYRSGHIGRLGEYCELAAERQFLSMLVVNTHGAARRVAPPGGCAPRLGTNPIAMGAPHDGGAIVLDFSTSATAEGKVRIQKIGGQPCPEGWLLDNRGRPTTDPETLYGDPPGTIVPMGGEQTYKGFGLALMIDIWAGALSGGLCSRETPLTQKGNCVFLLVVNPDAFGGASHYAAEVQQLIEFVRTCPLAEGADRIVLPGDPERQIAQQRSANGIPLDDKSWAQLLALAQKLNVPAPS